MDTTTGRFTSMDSYLGSVDDPVSLHKYLYANANPVNYIDPSGYNSYGEMNLLKLTDLNNIKNKYVLLVYKTWRSFNRWKDIKRSN